MRAGEVTIYISTSDYFLYDYSGPRLSVTAIWTYKPVGHNKICGYYVLKNSMASLGVPKKAVRPLASSSILSNMEYTSEDGWWMVPIIVLPLDAIDLSTLITFWAMYESSPEVGSSQNISGGSVNTCKTHSKNKQYIILCIKKCILTIPSYFMYLFYV